MAKGRDLSSHQSKIVKRYYQNIDTAMTQKLGEMVSELYLADTPAKQKTLWDRVTKALNNTDADPAHWDKFIKARNIEQLALFLGDLNLGNYPRKPKPEDRPQPLKPIPQPAESAPAQPAGQFDGPYLRHAMNQFKRRYKLTRLDDVSRLGRSPLSGGGSSNIVGITPPPEFPHAVWEELVRQGRLKKAGSNMYAMP
jgi:hypothetical protein